MSAGPNVPVKKAGGVAQPVPTQPDVWDRVAAMDEFRLLLLAKAEFVVPAVITFVVYYFALPIAVGYFPEFMDKKILGPVNIAYIFALSQFFVAWLIAGLYVRRAKVFDDYGHRIMQRLEREGK
jgi:uncharacterized membrane protein (DUF485 family)